MRLVDSFLQPPIAPRAYVTKVARSLAVDVLRSRTYEASVDREMLEGLAPEAEEDYDSINLMELIKSAVARMPARQRSVLLLTATGHHADEIGDLLGVAASTVHVHLFRARARLQKSLAVEDR
ncbi:sigma-70 family RNA polymerase sigma factor [Streptomyces sp. NBC_01142]|uniref:RNA polymerase sigma factor n=1 Tax=Streptomyces sp. NBC_01142 TaxID=2975865 RepID=UPI00225163A7|nr:sigma-70 family RNA polymerase sigma factor [Streptomyces sp. NBC_01142]MCX4821570.1 sigma-70 family RNA polymerase sigma factor [Streptomyces sp. NBC_01142]